MILAFGPYSAATVYSLVGQSRLSLEGCPQDPNQYSSRMKKIEMTEYQSSWPGEFSAIAGKLRTALGDQVLRIDHIGSTSIPGLVAKDVIDVQLTVASLDCADELIGGLSREGYIHNAQISNDNLVGTDNASKELRKLFFRRANGSRPTHIHIRELHRVNQQYSLLFRDYLRADPAVCLAYADIKRALAVHFSHDVSAYYSIKDPHMDTVYQAALLWREINGWQADQEYR